MNKKQKLKLILGIGCDRNVGLHTLNTAIDNALASIEKSREDVVALASIDKKNDEVNLLALAKQTSWPLHFFNAEQLSQVEVPNPSAVVMKYMGTPAVAEAAAILAAQTTMDDLLLEKYKFLGTDAKNATVSIVKG